MVKLRGPLLSLDASGSLADAITYSKWKGRHYARQRVVPTNPQSGAQTGRRAMLSFLSKQWDGLAAGDQATWQDIADDLVVDPFHAYLSENMKHWHNFLAPSMVTPITRTGTLGFGAPPLQAAWVEHQIKISVRVDTPNDNWGAFIFASLTGAFTTAVANCILLVLADTITTTHHFWTPPTRVKHYLNLRFFTADGKLSVEQGQVSATPP